MTEVKEAMIMIVVGGGSKPGGFCFRDLGPEKVLVEPGTAFPKSWVDPVTVEKYMKDGHLVLVGDEVVKEEVPETKVPTTKDDRFAEFCVFTEEDLKGMKRDELDNLVEDVYKQADVDEKPDFPNIPSIVAFLTGDAE